MRIFQKHLTVLAFALFVGLLGCQQEGLEPMRPYIGEFDQSIMKWIRGVPEFDMLEQALDLTALADTLESGQFTVFAPGNVSFQFYLADKKFASLKDVPVKTLRGILLYNVLKGKYLREDFTPQTTDYPTLQGKGLQINYSDISANGRYYFMKVNGRPVATQNIKFKNGVVHTYGITGMEREGRKVDVVLLTP